VAHKANKNKKVNVPVVLTVTAICGTALLLFFLTWRPPVDLQPVATADMAVADTAAPLSEREYYQQEAQEYLQMLPADKEPLLQLINDSCHCLLYCERGAFPSCYAYDLDLRTTEVVFGGSNGFYCDTKLLMLDSIVAWKHVDNLLVFVGSNCAPRHDFTNAAVAFYLNVHSRRMTVIDYGSSAYFASDSTLVVNKAKKVYPGLLGFSPIYSVTPSTWSLR